MNWIRISARGRHRASPSCSIVSLFPDTAVLSIGPTPAWDAQVGHGAGTVTFSALNETGATGTFSFTLLPMVGTNAAGTHTVTNGTFNVKFKINGAGSSDGR